MSRNVCRTCLAVNKRMYDLRTTHLQDLFEKLTSVKLITEDGRCGLCYICYLQLQKCQRFINMSQDADKMFKQVFTKGFEITSKSDRALNNFIMTPVDCVSVPDRATETLITVKIEPADIKEEVIDLDDSGLLETVKTEGTISDNFMKEVCGEDHRLDVSDIEPCRDKDLNTNKKKSAYNCIECNKEFSRFDCLKNHMDNHNDDTIYACSMCDETFSSKIMLQCHIRKHTKPHACSICDKTFSELSTLRKHLASHSPDKPFICGNCNKGFTHKAFLVVHLRMHTGEKPFACDLCDKTFGQVGHLISHKRSHLKIKPFPCSICHKSFGERNTLKKHVRRMHNALKPFSCDICNRTFSTQDEMQRHERNHEIKSKRPKGVSGVKPSCVQCGQGFSTVGNMRRHMKAHKKNNRDLCELQNN